MDEEELVERARHAVERSYAPYSEYYVGAALRTSDGEIFVGCNAENANYANSLHAEEVAIGSALAAGHREFAVIAVSSAERDGITPCGTCRQTLSEFCDDDFRVLCDEGDDVTEYALDELLPAAMGPETLGIEAE